MTLKVRLLFVGCDTVTIHIVSGHPQTEPHVLLSTGSWIEIKKNKNNYGPRIGRVVIIIVTYTKFIVIFVSFIY